MAASIIICIFAGVAFWAILAAVVVWDYRTWKGDFGV